LKGQGTNKMARYNITSHGAFEGNLNNLPQIQLAIDAANANQGGEVFFPEGT
jgi:polygalacturonase